MIILVALSVAGAVVVFVLLWQWHRVTSRRLSEIQTELSAVRDLMSRIFLTQMRAKDGPLHSGVPTQRSADSTEATDAPEKNDALQ
jgi:hypothetical protein